MPQGHKIVGIMDAESIFCQKQAKLLDMLKNLLQVQEENILTILSGGWSSSEHGKQIHLISSR